MKKKSFKNKLFLPLLIALIAFGVASSCRKNELDPAKVELGYEYTPLALGSSWIYVVDSIYYDQSFGLSDTFKYLVKETAASSLVEGDGDTSFLFNRHLADTGSSRFMSNSNFSVNRSRTRYEIFKNDQKTIHLVYPPSLFQYWDGNAYNSLDVEEYQIIDQKDKETINGNTYDSTLHVLLRDRSNFVQENYGIEIYAKNYGLVYKELIDINTQTIDSVSKKSGYKVIYNLKSYQK